MKKWLFALFFVFLLSFTAACVTACINDNKELCFTYDRTTDSYAVNAGTDKYKKAIVIPNEYKGKPVTTIPSDAFKDSTAESIVLPPNIKKIEENAFLNCNGLKKV